MASQAAPIERLSFLHFPPEVRNLVYKQLLCASVTKTQKPFPDTCRSAVRYDWNLQPAILATNRQIHTEARNVLGSENTFVVIECAAKELEQKKSDMGKEDTRIMMYNVKLWPGKQCETVNVPNERMRILFSRDEEKKNTKAKRKAQKPWYCVVLLEELRDLIVGISTFQSKGGSYRTSGLSALITLSHTTDDETEVQRDARETRLLDPLLSLRFLKSVKVEGALESNSRYLSDHICRQQCDSYIVYSTFTDLVRVGDEAYNIGHHDVATGYYNRAHDYALHFTSKEPKVIVHHADPSACLFRINLQRARNWIEQDNFEDALGAAECALSVANQLFRTNEPAIGPPPVDERGGISAGKFRQWTCECIKDGAAKFGQRIKCEDVGRAYYYRSIAGHVVNGDEATDQAYEDRALGIGCCVVSETNPGNLPRELLELDARTMQRIKTTDWEDVMDSD